MLSKTKLNNIFFNSWSDQKIYVLGMIVKIVVGTSSYNVKQILIARKLKKKFTFIKKYKRENKELIPFKQNLVKSTKFKLIDAKFKLSKVIQAKKKYSFNITNQPNYFLQDYVRT